MQSEVKPVRAVYWPLRLSAVMFAASAAWYLSPLWMRGFARVLAQWRMPFSLPW